MNIAIALKNYVRDSLEESKKVTWPTRRETLRYSILVLIITIVLAAAFGGLDFFFNWLLGLIV